MALTPSPTVITKIKTAKASARKVLDLVKALEAAEAALETAREKAAVDATQAHEALEAWIEDQRDALNAIEAKGADLAVDSYATDDEAQAILDVEL